MRGRPLVSIVGSGRVGTACALFLMMRSLCDIRLIDVVQGLPQGEALDISHAASILGIDLEIEGSNDLGDVKGSDIVIVTAGFARKPGMTREELAIENGKIVREICERVRESAPDSIVIVVTNPVDIMTSVALKVLKFPRERVIGFSGILDSGRYRFLIAKRLGVSVRSVEAYVVGQHGERMVPLVSSSRVCAQPLARTLSRDEIDKIRERVVKAGEEIIKLKGWSASHAVGAGVSELVEDILRDKRRLENVSAMLQGEYGVRDVVAEVLAIVGRDGIVKIVEIDMDEEERRAFVEAVNWIREITSKVLSSLNIV
ncbi:MAG: malate dehydrogenase [Crenarchaeota archaeon]|nr:malate dehydrogenase [Thermoproteota archaeon]